MNKKEKTIIVVFTIILISIITFILIKNNSYAVDENIVINQRKKIVYNEETLQEDITSFVNDISSIIIPNASYEDSDVLTENYDFLTIFAINYILKNKNYYQDKIIYGENYSYNYYDTIYTTNEYINIDEIYNITDIFFGKKYYLITNNYLSIKNNNLPLLLLNEYSLNLSVEDIKIEVKDEYINSYIKYVNNDLIYNFIFQNKDNYLVLYNITLEEIQ